MPHALPREWFGARIRNDGVARERVYFRGSAAAGYLWAAALLLAALLFYVWQGLQVIRIGYEIDRLQEQYRGLVSERTKLEVERASLEDLATVERVAVDRLGMVLPEPWQVVTVREAAPAGAGDGAPRPGENDEAAPDGTRERLVSILKRVGGVM